MLLVRLLRLADVKNGLKVQKVEIRIKSIEMFDKITVSEIEKSFGAQSIRISRQKKDYKSLAHNRIRTKAFQCRRAGFGHLVYIRCYFTYTHH